MHVDLAGKSALVTGANGGIGFEVAKGLLSVGAHVIITGRDKEKLTQAADFLRKDTGRDTIEIVLSDFSSLTEVRTLADQVGSTDILVNNAGCITDTQRLTADGFDLQWQVNFLAAAILSLTLGPQMPAGGRIVNVASGAHKRGTLDLADVNYDNRPYSGLKAYAQSKLAMVMLTRHLAVKWGTDGPNTYAVHPGVVSTDFARDAGLLGTLFKAFKPFYKSPRRGARGVLTAACGPFSRDETGLYYERMMAQNPAPAARDAAACQALYDHCNDIVTASA